MAVAERDFEVPQTSFNIDEVLQVHQKMSNWCGYASLSAVLSRWGFDEFTQEELFRHIHKYPKPRVNMEEVRFYPGPSVDTLAITAQELTSLQADLFTERQYAILREKGITPHSVLQSYLVRGIPCIVRFPSHFIVATGIDFENGAYRVMDPLEWKDRMRAWAFEDAWSNYDPRYPRDTRHLMLAIHP